MTSLNPLCSSMIFIHLLGNMFGEKKSDSDTDPTEMTNREPEVGSSQEEVEEELVVDDEIGDDKDETDLSELG